MHTLSSIRNGLPPSTLTCNKQRRSQYIGTGRVLPILEASEAKVTSDRLAEIYTPFGQC